MVIEVHIAVTREPELQQYNNIFWIHITLYSMTVRETFHDCGCDCVCCCGDHVSVNYDLQHRRCYIHVYVPVSLSHASLSLSLDLSPRAHASNELLSLDPRHASSSVYHHNSNFKTIKTDHNVARHSQHTLFIYMQYANASCQKLYIVFMQLIFMLSCQLYNNVNCLKTSTQNSLMTTTTLHWLTKHIYSICYFQHFK